MFKYNIKYVYLKEVYILSHGPMFCMINTLRREEFYVLEYKPV
jgi:hypothetical protein